MHENFQQMEEEPIKMIEDKNTFMKLIYRLRKPENRFSPKAYIEFVANLIINIWHSFMINF